MSSASDTATDEAGQSAAPAIAGSAIRYRWFLAALGVYAGATLVFLYVEPLLVRFFGPNPCCQTEGLGPTRIAALAWLGFCALAACIDWDRATPDGAPVPNAFWVYRDPTLGGWSSLPSKLMNHPARGPRLFPSRAR